MTEKIKLTFLGTSAQVPTAKKNHTAILISLGNENILVDCGEGTQRQFKKAHVNPMKLTKILITHWHGDHVLGIPGLLQTLAANNYKKKLFIYGPKGTERFMKAMLNVFVFSGKIDFEVREIIQEGIFFENDEFLLEAKKVFHGIPANSYSIVQKGKVRINKKKLDSYNISPGQHLKKLKRGKDIIYKGKKFSAKNLTYREGDKKISFVLDSGFDESIAKFVDGADLLVCESTYGGDKEEMAREYKHMTNKQAAKIAKTGKVKKLILTHLSGRYELKKKEILEEAKKIFKKISIAEDLEKIEV
jgi:ribonuclease Z